MPEQTFEYTALDPKGKRKKGTLIATDSKGAFACVKDQGMHVLQLRPTGQGLGEVLHKIFKRRLSNTELLMMVKQLHTMIQAHLPLIEALNTLREIYDTHFLGATLEKIEADVLRGETFSSALRAHPTYFDSIFTTTIAQGEENNRLKEALFHYQNYLNQKITIKSQVRKAFAYPIFLTVAFTLLATFLSIYLLPSMGTFMAQNNPNNEDPMVWLRVIQYIEAYGFLTLGSMISLTIALYIFSRFWPPLNQIFSRLRLKLPFVGEITALENIRLYIQGLELLCRDGHDLPRSLNMAYTMIQSAYLKSRMAGLDSKINQGTSLYQSLRPLEFIPPVALRMIKIGEQTGQLPWAFEQIGEYLNHTLLEKINRMGRILEPLLLFIMGGFLLAIVLCIFMPLYGHLGDFQ